MLYNELAPIKKNELYKEHQSYHTPEKELTVWRYLDFAKFVDLITSQKLFFCRSDNFEDPFEGIFRLKDYEKTKNIFEDQEIIKKYYFLNCWHINENQSDAMWKIFLDTKNGIAIKSTVGNIIESLRESEDNINISKVYYRDFNKVTFQELMLEKKNKMSIGRSINQFNYKRTSFEHEKELRLFHVDLPIPHVIKNGIPREPLTHKHIDIDISELINEIVIAPFADDWFKTMVESLTKKLNLNFKTTKSELYNFF